MLHLFASKLFIVTACCNKFFLYRFLHDDLIFETRDKVISVLSDFPIKLLFGCTFESAHYCSIFRTVFVAASYFIYTFSASNLFSIFPNIITIIVT